MGLALVFNTVAGSMYTRRQIKRATAELQADIAIRVASRIRAFVNAKLDRLSDVSVSMSLYPLGSEEQRLLALLLLRNDSAITDISLLDGKGMEVVKVSERRIYIPSELTDQSASERYKRAIKGENYVSRVYTSDKAEPYVTLAVPMRLTHQETIGVVSAEANLKTLWEIIGNTSFGGAGYAYLVDRTGNLIAYKDPSLVLKRSDLSHIHAVQEFLRNPTGIDPTPAQEGSGITGQTVLSTFARVTGLGWGVILEEPLEVALADVKKLERYAGLILGLGLLVGTVIIVWVSNQITKPVRELHRGAAIIGSGNLDYRVDIHTGDEIEQLSKEFNKMAADLKTSYRTLEQKVAHRTKELSALYSIATVINQSLDIGFVLHSVLIKVLEIFNFEAGRIYLMDGDGKELRLTAHEGFPKELALPSTYKPGEGLLAKIFATGEPLFFEDIQSDPEFHRLAVKKVMLGAGYRAQIWLPVRAKGKIIGVVDFVSKKARRFSPSEIELVHSVADQMGLALENAALFSEIKQKSQELEKLYRELQEASRAKSEFMAAMSHELRTPLNVIIGNADLARDGFFGEVSEKQKESMEKILRYSEMLLKLINDVLTLSKIEARKMSLNRSTFSLEEIITHAKTHVEQLNRGRHLEVLWNVDENLSPITTDALKLEEILQNLIGNAFKFTPHGRIEVRVRGLQEKNRVEFAVTDSGIGIEKGEVENIFDEFHQLKGAHTGDYSGVGLGLSIVKKYVELMHGDIRVESEPGVGSTFTFSIPYSV